MHKYERIPIRNVCMVADIAINNLVLFYYFVCVCASDSDNMCPYRTGKPRKERIRLRLRLKAHIVHRVHVCVAFLDLCLYFSIFEL